MFNLYIYSYNIYIINYKTKAKGKMVSYLQPIFLLVIKLRINKRFKIISKFLVEEILFLMSLSFIIKIQQA